MKERHEEIKYKTVVLLPFILNYYEYGIYLRELRTYMHVIIIITNRVDANPSWRRSKDAITTEFLTIKIYCQ